MFFVSGITGKVGGAAARLLLAEGHTVRALARDPLKAAEWSQKGVDVRRGLSSRSQSHSTCCGSKVRSASAGR